MLIKQFCNPTLRNYKFLKKCHLRTQATEANYNHGTWKPTLKDNLKKKLELYFSIQTILCVIFF